MLRCTVSIAAALVVSCVTPRPPSVPSAWRLVGESKEGCAKDDDWLEMTPLEFLSTLRKTEPWMIFRCSHDGWVGREHIPQLIELLDSDEPCASVMLSISSFLGPRSTVGNEAAYIIQGYRAGKYPPASNSNRPLIDRDEIRRWWSEQQRS